MFNKQDCEIKKAQKFEKQVKNAEIRMACYFAEHNVSIQSAECLTEVVKKCFPDSKIAEAVTLKKDKCTAIISNVLAN